MSLTSFYFVYEMWKDDPKNFKIMDHSQLLFQLIFRSVVIAIKYAFYSDIHNDMFYSINLGFELNSFDLMLSVMFRSDPEELLKAID